MLSINPCNLCPRECGSDRNAETGFCGCDDKIKVARAALHFWEEPCLSGKRGSGTVFFTGCTLRCCYCQNREISSGGIGREVTVERLADIFLELQDKGAHNINLVTASQYLPFIIKSLDIAKPRLHIPVVYNCGGYEKKESIRALMGYVDIFLHDLKYFSAELSAKYSLAANYFEVATAALKQMISQTGAPLFDSEGMLQKGVMIRHLVLPGGRKDSLRVLQWINDNLPKGEYMLSLMSQFTPNANCQQYKELNRRITSFEYNSVVDEAIRLGLVDGFMQERSSAKEEYTPPFDFEGV